MLCKTLLLSVNNHGSIQVTPNFSGGPSDRLAYMVAVIGRAGRLADK